MLEATALDLSLTPDLRGIFKIAAKAGRAYQSTVMLLGETGVGKTRIAKHIHDTSERADKPFQVIDLSQATSSIFESEFFGHEKGAFTGASQTRKSPLEEADGGTVFLDEIGTLSFELQARLLRLVQEKKFKRVGGVKDISIDVRIIVATSLDLEEKVKKGEFREDLYYRLNVLQIYVPPLRKRLADIIPLAESFLKQASIDDRIPAKILSPQAKNSLLSHGWPGNVRALENEMKRATIMGDEDVIEPSDLSFNQRASDGLLHEEDSEGDKISGSVKSLSQFKTFAEIEAVCDEAKRYIYSIVLPKNNFSKMKCAVAMHANPTTMGSRFTALFQSDDANIDKMRSALEEWESQKLSHPNAALAEKIAQEVLEEDLQIDSTEAVERILTSAKKERIKKTMIDCGFHQKRASMLLGIDANTLSNLVNKHTDLKLWIDSAKMNFKKLEPAIPVPL